MKGHPCSTVPVGLLSLPFDLIIDTILLPFDLILYKPDYDKDRLTKKYLLELHMKIMQSAVNYESKNELRGRDLLIRDFSDNSNPKIQYSTDQSVVINGWTLNTVKKTVSKTLLDTPAVNYFCVIKYEISNGNPVDVSVTIRVGRKIRKE